ncbi:MAG: ATP-binding cassette domain-containing protein [Nitrososphaeria archaeon]|nr:ATP-binding cassette domain-containing protein [Nitrosopumilaceae archaeon]NDB88424.1 ATP-binding cassette domain-containing protein [Nitrososphaerota archaeon]NDF28660.1 ATP-binding cassette domain-containing protein [Nitrososphaeria archaeon]NDB62438.1 ATP-binding cassette domain-containing protein [Nitrosopumilaceae archaeon]NDB90405.1 ATP-binding cassette domain-containing protein [Nitrososphaerota archaeon]
MYSIQTKDLKKIYTSGTVAVDEISFDVEEGEIFGFLGPNGAGKSTTMMILTTLLKPSGGQAFVAGFDVSTQQKNVRANIGYVQQDITIDEYLTGRENLLLQARLNHIPKDQIKPRINDLLDLVELDDKADDAAITYSGGMRKRLEIAGGLLHRPKVLFLDEPTVGLDIQTRQKIWEYIKKIHNEYKMTIFLTTHYMEEADRLCSKVGIIDHGKIQTIDSPSSLKSKLGGGIITITIENSPAKEELVSKTKQIEFVRDVTISDEKLTIFSSKGTEVAPMIFSLASNLGVSIKTVSITQPSLDDVFLSFTGHDLRDDTTQKSYNRRKEYRLKQRMKT